MKKYINLLIVLVIIIGIIAFLQSKKISPKISGGNEGDIIPISAVTSGATSSAISKEDLAKIISDKAKKYSRVREIVQPAGFINSDPFHISDYVGKKVILVDFWTYSCINCQRTLPYLTTWYDKYEKDGFIIIGIHSPEFEFEKNYDNVKKATEKYGVKYPVVLDNDMGTWNSYSNRFWPAHYLVDIDGFVVEKHIGEGGYEQTEMKIKDLLKERMDRLGITALIPAGTVKANYTIDAQSPETYFGFARNGYLSNGTQGQQGNQTLTIPNTINANSLYLEGTWNFAGEFATNQNAARIVYKYNAKNVFLVAKADKPVTLKIKKDGVEIKKVTVQNADLYPLIQDTTAGEHTLEIIIDSPGLQAYTFTFG